MERPSGDIGSAKVIFYTKIDERHNYTGNCMQIVSGKAMGVAAGLAIYQYEGEENFYLFGCDENWNTITDTCHITLKDAIDQAEFEYEGANNTWQAL